MSLNSKSSMKTNITIVFFTHNTRITYNNKSSQAAIKARVKIYTHIKPHKNKQEKKPVIDERNSYQTQRKTGKRWMLLCFAQRAFECFQSV